MLSLYNTMTRSVDPLQTIQDNQVGIYTCGPTVYNYAHIGNLRTYVFEDILVRALRQEVYQVLHVMNVTDVGHLQSNADEGEDKMILGALREGKIVWDIADFYWQAFRRDMTRLNLREPDIWCRATDHIAEQIDMVKQLEAKGLTYQTDDGVYFDTAQYADYGKLARLDIKGLKTGARIEMTDGKRQPTDFALWKFSPPNQQRLMEWDSPWGTGFPGWHIECSAMALHYLGAQIDIHCGGIDHIAVHHTNEIAQAEGITGQAWVNWWMHGAFLVLDATEAADGAKMSKSTGDFITLDTVIGQGFDPFVYRYFCLGVHYRSPLTFSWSALQGAANGFDRLKNRVLELKRSTVSNGTIHAPSMQAFSQAVHDDLNMPRALAAMWGMLREDGARPEDQYVTLLAMDEILGLSVETIEEDDIVIDSDIQQMINAREQARANRDFQTADRIRDDLLEREIVLEDTPEGAKIRPK